MPKDHIYKLSDLYNKELADKVRGFLELSVEIVDIRYSAVKESEILSGCESLHSYSKFIDQYNTGTKVEDLIEMFKNDKILGPILRKESLVEMVKTELTQRDILEAAVEAAREDAKAEGELKGRAEGELKGEIKILYQRLKLTPEQIAQEKHMSVEDVNHIIKASS